jgi:uncharacterized delta-60 repeat protein
MKYFYVVCLSMGCLFTQAAKAASAGDLDLSFNSTGIVATLPTLAGTGFNGNDVIQQADGKLVAAGYRYNKKGLRHFAVLRYNSDGSLDTTFNGTGATTTVFSALPIPFDYAQAIIQQDDGKLVAAGNSLNAGAEEFALARYNKDGSLDVTFGEAGLLTTSFGAGNDKCYSVIQQADGKLVAAGLSYANGNADFALVRYNRDGSLDDTFGGDGMVTAAVGAGHDFGQTVIQLADGKLLMTGRSDDEFAMVRLNADGSLDATFDTDGKMFVGITANPDYALSVIQQADDKIVIAGYTSSAGNYDLAIARYNLDGSFDVSFSGDGKLTMPIGSSSEAATSVIQQMDGKLVMGGYSYVGGNIHFALVRLSADGSLDTTFNTDGKLTTAVGSVNDQAFSVIQ